MVCAWVAEAVGLSNYVISICSGFIPWRFGNAPQHSSHKLALMGSVLFLALISCGKGSSVCCHYPLTHTIAYQCSNNRKEASKGFDYLLHFGKAYIEFVCVSRLSLVGAFPDHSLT